VREQLDLRDGLVGEAAAHHEARVAGAAAQVHQAALGQQDDALAVGEDDVVDLRLDLFPGQYFSSEAMSISLSKWPMLQTMAWSFIAAMCARVMTCLLPVA
jgi:hypothetical protein